MKRLLAILALCCTATAANWLQPEAPPILSAKGTGGVIFAGPLPVQLTSELR